MFALLSRNSRALMAYFGFALLAGAASAQPMPGGGPMGFGGPAGPTEVGVITLHEESIPVTTELPGRVSASQTADVRPQVGGIVRAINFQPGQEVKAGDVLFELEDASLRAQLTVQQAALQKAETSQSSAEAKVARFEQLAGNNSVSQTDLLDAQAALAQAKADVASAEASLEVAQLNLSYAKVTAPISGIVSETDTTKGALVVAGQATALATIRQIDPVYVDMVDSSANLVKSREQFLGEGSPPLPASDLSTPSVELILENGETYDETGTLKSPDVVVSESTGTFTIRSSFANPDRVLLPGMFVRATVSLGFDRQGFRVAQRAVTFDAAGQPSALFVEGGKAVKRNLTINGNSGNDWIVTAGITDGAQLIVDGLQKVQAGAEVSPLEVTLDENGVVVEPSRPAGMPPASGAGAPPADGSGMPAIPEGTDMSNLPASSDGAGATGLKPPSADAAPSQGDK